MRGDEQRYVLFPSRRKLVVALAIAVTAFLLAVLATSQDIADGATGLRPRIAAIVALSTCIYFIVTLSLRLLIPRPIVEVDASGVAIPGVAQIDWNDLQSIEVQKMPFRCLVFRLREGSGHRRFYRLLPPYSEKYEPLAVLTLAEERSEDVLTAILLRRPAG